MKCISWAVLTDSCANRKAWKSVSTRVTREYAEKEAPDAIIVAAGSDPVLPPIPGLREAKT